MSLASFAGPSRSIGGRVETEASGGITLDNLREVGETGVDFVSLGALTHSVEDPRRLARGRAVIPRDSGHRHSGRSGGRTRGQPDRSPSSPRATRRPSPPFRPRSAALPAEKTPSSWPTATSGPKSRTWPTTWATRCGSRASPPPRPQSTIVFCGVAFMAETAKILSPDKRVLLPDLAAGCSLADSITVEQLRAWKAEHPGAVVVSYVNTTAAVKAESDYCCTSGNARAVIEAIPRGPPDPLPAGHVPGHVAAARHRSQAHDLAGRVPRPRRHPASGRGGAGIAAEPGAELLIHPECGCTSQVIEAVGDDAHILSTEGMVTYAERSAARRASWSRPRSASCTGSG